MNSKTVLAVVVLVAVLIGGNFTALKFALDHSTPLLIAGMRTIIGGTFLLGFAFLRGEKFPTNKRDLLHIFVVSFSITTVSSGLLVFGVSRVTAGVASLIASTMPLFTAVIALALMKTQISRLAAGGLAVGFRRHSRAGITIAGGCVGRCWHRVHCSFPLWLGRLATCT